MFLVSAAAAPLMARIAPARLVTGGLALVAVGMGLLLITGEHASWPTVLPATVTAPLGTGLLNPALSALASSSFSAGHTSRRLQRLTQWPPRGRRTSRCSHDGPVRLKEPAACRAGTCQMGRG